MAEKGLLHNIRDREPLFLSFRSKASGGITENAFCSYCPGAERLKVSFSVNAISLVGAELGTGVTIWHHYWNCFKFSTGQDWGDTMFDLRKSQKVFLVLLAPSCCDKSEQY